MTHSLARFIPICLSVFLLAACRDAPPPAYELADLAFGQVLQMTLKGVSEVQTQDAASTALADLHFIEEVSNPWRPGPLARTNQLLAFEAEFSANPSVLPLIRRATELAEASQGYFNPALGNLRQLWGLHHNVYDKPLTTPTHESIEALLNQRPTMQDIQLSGIRMKGCNPALRIDFGPFAQGFALDTAMLRLQEAGISYASIENGGFTTVYSSDAEQRHVVTVSLMNNQAITLSLASNEALALLDSERHAFLSPWSGKPVAQPSIAIVIANSAADAAAVAEALLHIPPGQEIALLQRMGVEHALLQRHLSSPQLTPGMLKRLSGANELEPHLMVSGQ